MIAGTIQFIIDVDVEVTNEEELQKVTAEVKGKLEAALPQLVSNIVTMTLKKQKMKILVNK